MGAGDLGRVAVIAILALSVRALLQFQIQLAGELGFRQPSFWWNCLLLAVTVPIGIVIHEFGHFAAGTLSRQCCRSIVIGPLEFARSRGWRVRRIPLRRAGMVDLVPRTFDRFRSRRALCVLGGPLSSLLSGLVFLALSYRAPTALLFWLLSCAAQWSLVGLLGLLPMRRDEARSDGYLLWELLRGGAVVDDLQRNLLVATSQATPLRLGDWPHDLVLRLAAAPAKGEVGRYSAYLAFVHLLDRGETAEAAVHLDRLMADWTSTDPPEYALEAAYFLAVHSGRQTEAERWLALESRDAEPWVRLRAQAAVERRRDLAGQALASVRAAPPSGAHQYEIDRLTGMLC